MPRPLVAALLLLALPALAQDAADPLRAGPLDNGKMWLFEDPPLDYLAETYDFRPDAAWFERARLAALRLPNCSAGFVSADGLVATNHHCVRDAIVAVSREGESLVDGGFIAATLADERRVPGLYLDQLVRLADVTGRVEAALAGAQTDAERAAAREAVLHELEHELTTGPDERTQIVSLYNGGRFSAYTFRRFEDVRLVAAPENALGFFGGDPDNFTFPRYALDYALLRVYDGDRPHDASAYHFRWSTEGVSEGDVLFVIGNPGSTDRGDTVAQLHFRRDVTVPLWLEFLDERLRALDAHLAVSPDEALQNARFALSNARKAYRGRREALQDPVIMARRADFERQFRAAVAADAALEAEFGGLFAQMEALQNEKRALRAEATAFQMMLSTRFASPTLLRGFVAAQLLAEPEGSARAAQLREALAGIADLPADLDEAYLAGQIRTFQRHLPETVAEALGGRSASEAARAIRAGSAFAAAAGTEQALAGTLPAGDPAVALMSAVLPRFADYQSAWAGLTAQEQEVARQLGRARFAVFGTSIPPDATFSPRFTDGVVRGYPYNGTVAPPYTTFWGLYDRHFGHAEEEWALPARWLPAPPALDLATPVNFVSTADTIGGNSGSPAVTPNLELVGINFDRTIEGLSRDYIYFADRGRNVMVDARAVLASLEAVYGAAHLARELREGRLAPNR